MDMAAKLKAALFLFISAVFVGLPLQLALAAAIFAAVANLFGMFAALRQRERISGQKILLGLLRIWLYLLVIPILWYAASIVGVEFVAKAMGAVFVAYEVMLLLEKAYELGIIPKRIVDRLTAIVERALNKVFGDGNSN